MSIPDAIKVQIPQINLSFNQFSEIGFQQLLDFFSKIQLPISHLDFSNNRLYDYSLEQNFELLTALPKSLQAINMTNSIKEAPSMLGALQEKLRLAGSKLNIHFHSRVNE